MQIERGRVVTLAFEMKNAQGETLEQEGSELAYLHGGFGGIFPKVEDALEGKQVGHEMSVTLEPEDAFGEYDAELLRVEPRERFPETLEVGMQFEGVPEDGDDEDTIIYTITDVAEDKVVLDGNHPLAGMALRFWLKVSEVREATGEEVEHGHAHGASGIEVVDEDEDGEDSPRTLH